MKTRTLLGLLILAVLVTGCQGMFNVGGSATVSGTVTVDGQPPGDLEVEVALAGTRFVSTADGETGAFEITGIPPGNYHVVTQGRGVGAASEAVVLKRGDEVTGIELATEFLPPLPYTVDFADPMAVRLVEPMNGSPFQLAEDNDGKAVYELEPIIIDRPAGAGGNYRYALLKYPNLDEFAMEIEVGGPSPLNPTFVLGWQDIANYHYVFLTASAAARVGHVRNGNDTDQLRPGVTDLWQWEADEYRLVRIEVVRRGDNYHFRTYIDGEFIDVLEKVVPADQYVPGRIGFGSHNSGQRFWFGDIHIEEL